MVSATMNRVSGWLNFEKNGKGLNLTKEVRDGILNHSSHALHTEGKVVRLSDKIAYINHDIDDAIRAKS